MKPKSSLTAACLVAVLGASSTYTVSVISLFDYAFNTDGAFASGSDPVPGNVNDALFNYTTGLGTLTMSISGAGPHFLGFFVDHEIDEAINTFFNENGSAVGIPTAGQTWEIDEPGFVFGNIYTHLSGSTAAGSLLDNSTAVPPGGEDDVSMALGGNFILNPGEAATLSFLLSETAPISGFYLAQTDPDSGGTVYFSSSLAVSSVPDGGATLTLLAAGLAALGLLSRRMFGKQPHTSSEGRCGR